jgi:hypothetical protein
MTGIQLAMTPTGSISGRVYDRDGEPVGKAQVSALRSIYQDGRRRLTIVQSVQTNDRGEYRIYWLAPGNYYVSAKPEIAEIPDDPRSPNSITSPTERVTAPTRFGSYEQASSAIVRKRTLRSGEVVEETYVPTYYPGVVESPSATAIPVGPGANVLGIDMSIASSIVPARHIRGRVISPANAQPERVSVAAVPATSEPLISLPTAQLDANGLFDISGATPGRYYIVATADTAQGITAVDVGGADLQNVAVVMTSAFRVSGKFTIEGRSRSGTEPRITDLRVAPFVRDPNLLGMTSSTLRFFSPPPEPDGSFLIDGVSPGDFRVTIRGIPPDAYVKAIRIGGSDVLDSGLHLTKAPENPMEVVIGLNAGQVTGSIVNDRREPVANRTVVLVPNVRLRHRTDLYKKVSTDNAGRFRFQGITPGDYQLFAWNEVEPGAWQDPEFIRVYENRGTAIQISEGSDETVQLTVIP